MIEAARWIDLSFLRPPWCACCGLPFETIEEHDARCGACLGRTPEFDRARAALLYDDTSRTLALDLKRRGRRDGLATFAAWMAAAGDDLIQDSDLIACVPLHWTRLYARRFNQSAWLAQALAAETGKRVVLDALVRIKAGRSQEGLNGAQRRRNVRAAFTVPKRSASLVQDRSVLLVDDVLTTGATVKACARALKKKGAKAVNVLTLARVVRPTDISI